MIGPSYFRDIQPVLALFDSEDEGPMFHCDFRDYRYCTHQEVWLGEVVVKVLGTGCLALLEDIQII
jgi:hypothetical protein